MPPVAARDVAARPTATSPTPANETTAATQKRALGRSVPEHETEERGEDRDRAEKEPDRRRGRKIEREDEAELVQRRA